MAAANSCTHLLLLGMYTAPLCRQQHFLFCAHANVPAVCLYLVFCTGICRPLQATTCSSRTCDGTCYGTTRRRCIPRQHTKVVTADKAAPVSSAAHLAPDLQRCLTSLEIRGMFCHHAPFVLDVHSMMANMHMRPSAHESCTVACRCVASRLSK